MTIYRDMDIELTLVLYWNTPFILHVVVAFFYCITLYSIAVFHKQAIYIGFWWTIFIFFSSMCCIYNCFHVCICVYERQWLQWTDLLPMPTYKNVFIVVFAFIRFRSWDRNAKYMCWMSMTFSISTSTHSCNFFRFRRNLLLLFSLIHSISNKIYNTTLSLSSFATQKKNDFLFSL